MTSANAAPAAQSVEQPQQDIKTNPDAATEQAKPEGDAPEQPKSDEIPDVEKLKKRVEKQDRRIQRKDAALHEERRRAEGLQRELDKHRQSATQPRNETPQPKAKVLKPEDFGSVEEFVTAVANQAVEAFKKELEAGKAKTENVEPEQLKRTEQEIVQEATAFARRQAVFQQKAESLEKLIPDYSKVMSENSKAVVEPHVMDALHECEDVALVTYYAVKEDLLDDLNAMSPSQAAAYAVRLEAQAKSLLQGKPVSKAPAPMKPTGGTAAGSKSVDTMSPKELMAWARS